jgi:hypothetical protein
MVRGLKCGWPGGVMERGQVIGFALPKAFELICARAARPIEYWVAATLLAQLRFVEWQGGTRVRILFADTLIAPSVHQVLEQLAPVEERAGARLEEKPKWPILVAKVREVQALRNGGLTVEEARARVGIKRGDYDRARARMREKGISLDQPV